MAYVLKAFITNAQFCNNTPGDIAPFGELSNYSSTFSKEKGTYVNTSVAPNLQMVSFTAQNNGVNIALASDLVTRTLTIAQWIYAQTIKQTGQIFGDQLLSQLLTQFASSATTFDCGAIINTTLQSGVYYIPEWVSWVDTASGTTVKLWFVDASFQTQYDDFTIVVVPPLANLDTFFGTAVQVQAALTAVSYVNQIQNIQSARGSSSETIIDAESFNYVDPQNASNLIATNWTVLVYGPMGDNVDSISDALTTYILANSSKTQAQWSAILPDLFLRTEFVIVPLWDQYAIPPRSNQTAIYSPQVNAKRVNALVKSVVSSYATAHIDSYLNIVSSTYQSLQLAVIGSADNRNSAFELIDEFPDLINVPTTSSDFARMTQVTQKFVIDLNAMLQTCESMTSYSSIASGYTKLTRDGHLYLVLNYNNIHYLVLAKQELTTVITGVVAS